MKFSFEIGQVYQTQAGQYVAVLGRTTLRGYECLICSDGRHRYDRSTSKSDAGRVTGTDHGFRYAHNFKKVIDPHLKNPDKVGMSNISKSEARLLDIFSRNRLALQLEHALGIVNPLIERHFARVKEVPCPDCGQNHGVVEVLVTDEGKQALDLYNTDGENVKGVTINGVKLTRLQVITLLAALNTLRDATPLVLRSVCEEEIVAITAAINTKAP